MLIKFLDGISREITHLSDADLSGANLRHADLSDADLSGANLRAADLRGANLRAADLCGANISDADLCGADLRGANISGANLRGVDLCGADLRGANISDADLRGVDLCGANISDADLRGVDLCGAELPHFQICPEAGAFRAFKQVQLMDGSLHVIEIEIARTAQRTSSLIGRKCRASKIRVLPGQPTGMSPTAEHKTTYTPGGVYEVTDFNPDIRVECAAGIHFFMTRREAEEYR